MANLLRTHTEFGIKNNGIIHRLGFGNLSELTPLKDML